MKLRLGYVSNSSSSSWILYITEDEDSWSPRFRHFMNYLRSLYETCTDSTYIEHDTKEDYLMHLRDWEPEQAAELEKQWKEYSNEGFIELRVAYRDKFIEDVVEDFIKSGEFKEVMPREEA